MGRRKFRLVWSRAITFTKLFERPMIGEELPAQSEDDNDHGKHAVVVMMDGCTVGHSASTVKHSAWFMSSNVREQG